MDVLFWDSAQISTVVGLCCIVPPRYLWWQAGVKALVLPFSDCGVLLLLPGVFIFSIFFLFSLLLRRFLSFLFYLF